jgi:hypothetical protein
MRSFFTLPKAAVQKMILASALVTSVPASVSAAQTITVARFEVPFSFTVASTVLPAGTYEVRRLNGNTLSVSSWGNTIYATYYSDISPSSQQETSVVFKCKGDQFYLTRVIVASSKLQLTVASH